MSGWKQSYRGVGEMLCMPEMQADMLARALRVAAVAEATAPVDTGSGHPGRYKRGFRVESGIRGGHRASNFIGPLTEEESAFSGGRKRRAYGRVTNIAPEAYFVEYGTKNNPRHRTLGKALSAAGDA